MSISRLEKSELLYKINNYRILKKMCFISFSGLLNKLSDEHVENMVAGEYEFGLTGSDIRRNKVSPFVKRIFEVVIQAPNSKDVVEELLKNPESKLIIENPAINLAGISWFQLGNKTFAHLLLAETL